MEIGRKIIDEIQKNQLIFYGYTSRMEEVRSQEDTATDTLREMDA